MAVNDDGNDAALAGLSPEELAAINDDGDTDNDNDADALRAVAGDDDGADVTADVDDTQSDADDVADAALEDEVNAVNDFVPRQSVEAVDGFEAKMADIKQAKADLREQLNNGDIDLDQYEAKKDEISEAETTLRIKQSAAENAAKQNAHLDAERWKWEQEQFFGEKRNAIYQDKFVMAALNAAVIDLANDPKNASQKGTFFLNEADRIIRERFNIGNQQVKQGDKLNRKPDLSKIPKTLGDLPSAAIEDADGGEFSHLDKLTGMDLERALAKLSPEQVERYRIA